MVTDLIPTNIVAKFDYNGTIQEIDPRNLPGKFIKCGKVRLNTIQFLKDAVPLNQACLEVIAGVLGRNINAMFPLQKT